MTALVFFAGMTAGFILGMTAVARQWRRYCEFWRAAAMQWRAELDAAGQEQDQQHHQDDQQNSAADVHVSRYPGSRHRARPASPAGP